MLLSAGSCLEELKVKILAWSLIDKSLISELIHWKNM